MNNTPRANRTKLPATGGTAEPLTAPDDIEGALTRAVACAPARPGNAPPVMLGGVRSPLGALVAGATEQGLCLLEFTEPERLETQISRLGARLGAGFQIGEHALFDALREQLDAYFAGERTQFDIPLDLRGTPFQERAWNVLREIPYGQTRSYLDQAVALGRPGAVRAVARANGENRIAILIPCHRVLGKDGSLTGYGGGLWRKKFLLQREGAETQLALDGLE